MIMKGVMIVEDDPMAKKFLEMIVEGNPNYHVIHSIESAALAEAYCYSNKIDLILMDVCTAGNASGLKAASKIKRTFPNIRIIILTSQPEAGFINRAREGGIDSFWYKMMDEVEIIDVMNRTMAGENVYPQIIPVVMIGEASSLELSEMEINILRELTSGDTSKEIAARMNLSARTIENNIQRMLEKTGFKSKTRLAVEAANKGLVIRNV